MDLELAVTHHDDGVVAVQVTGDIDLVNTPELRSTLHALVDADVRRIVVDLDAVEFIDSTGLGVLIGCLRRLRSSGEDRQLAVVCSRPGIVRVLSITGLDHLLDVYSDLPEALKA